MLIMLSKQLRKIPFNKAVPFNDDDLMITFSPELAIVLRSVMDEDGKFFSIKNTMTGNKVFDCKDFRESCAEYSRIFHARLQRFFTSKKNEYMFFDLEEQDFLIDIFKKNNLSCVVDIYIKKKKEFEKVPFELLNFSEYKSLRPHLKSVGIQVITSIETYYNLNALKIEARNGETIKRNPFNLNDIFRRKEIEKINKITNKYPVFKDIKTKKEFNNAFRKLAKDLHPDTEFGSEESFVAMKESVELLKKTFWYRKLKEE